MPTANDIIKKAQKEIGVKENPAGSNKVKYNTDYYGRAVIGNAYPWCCTFIWWIFKTCGAANLFCGGKKTAYCPTVENYYKSIGQWFTSNPKVGDLVLFDFSRKGIASHIGILEKINADGTYTTIEGNTGVGNDANGGMVMRRIRKKAGIRGFARPQYNLASSTKNKAQSVKTGAQGGNKVTVSLYMLKNGSKGTNVKALQILLNGKGYNCGTADGDFGAKTLTAVKSFQSRNGLTADGIVGAQTWTKLLA